MDADRAQTLRRTALFDRHLAAGARMVEFAGWQMPVFYTAGSATSPIGHEHMAVRESCGIFDVSHMGEIQTAGPDALVLLQRLLSNDVGRIEVGGAQYGVMCREDGGVLDDLFTYRLGSDRYLTVTNAANHRGDLRWFESHAGDLDVNVEDRIDDLAMIAVQGPRAREIVAPMLDEGELPLRMSAATSRLGAARVLVCGTGYTGEDGVELLMDPAAVTLIWDRLVERGATPAGLAARDTLRIEACFHLYGNDLSVDRGPIEAGLGWCCREDTGFIGAEAVRAAREASAQRLVAFALRDGGIPRQGNPILGGGEVTSGTRSPCLGVGVGMGYVPVASAEPGTPLRIDVRGKIRAAIVKAKPIYRKGS